jgi:hypothetical protein
LDVLADLGSLLCRGLVLLGDDAFDVGVGSVDALWREGRRYKRLACNSGDSTLITTHLTNDRRKVFAVSLWWRGAVLILNIC